MTPVDGPAPALLIALLVLGVVALLAGSAFVARRRASRGMLKERPPTPGAGPPPEVETLPQAPTAPEGRPVLPATPPADEAPVVPPPLEAPAEAPPTVEAAPDEAQPEAPAAQAPPVEAPPVAPVEVAAEPTLAEPEVVSEPEPEPEPEPVKRKRGRPRPIGALRRLFRGSALTPADWDELEEALLRADVGVAATTKIVDALKARKDLSDGTAAVREELLTILGDQDRTLARKPSGLSVWLITGVNGSGKTTTIGKLAAQLREQGASVVLAAADTFRAAADQQLETWAERAGAQVVKHAPGADPAAVVFDGLAAAKARGADVLIVDTAGRLQNKRNLMEELQKIHKVLERESGTPDETLLVLDATTGQNGLQQARAFTEAASLSGLVLTKLDGSAKGGIVVGVQQELGIPVKLVGLGESIEDLAAFDPASFVDDLLAAEE